MRKMKWATVLVVAFSFSLMSVSGASLAAGIPDEQVGRLQPPDLNPGWIGAYLDDANTIMNPSFFYAGEFADIDRSQGLVCSSVNDVQCTKSTYFNFNAYLPRCAENPTVVTDCVENVRLVKANGEIIKGVFSTYMPKTTQEVFKGDPAKGLASGWNPSIWTFPGVTHDGGNEFLIFPGVFTWNAQMSDPSRHLQLFVNIFPISRVVSSSNHKPAQMFTRSTGESVRGHEIQSDDCPLWLGDFECAKPWQFPEGVRLGLTVKTSGPLDGWVHGRITEPSISAAKNGTGVTIEVEAGTTKVPVFGIWKKYSEVKTETKVLLDSLRGKQKGTIYNNRDGSVWNQSGVIPYDKLVMQHDLDNYTENTFQEFLAWLAESDDKALSTKSQWAFYTRQDQSNSPVATCSAANDGVDGIVSTNATNYLSEPPAFDAATKSLNYKVASPHFDKNGKVNLGSYDLAINSKLARCIYGYSEAPVQASVSVVNATGEAQVTTSTLTEKNGWLRLSVKGFTYSSPTVRVKLTQEAQKAEPTPAPSASASPIAMAKKSTITCVKGKATKKVTAVNPKCPTGYKKK
ncbi:MAG: hypothetical protein RLY79_270 [Actinomycetota bacterium]|jgi:hypothetical protein